MTGTVVRVESEKGFGFIKGEDSRDYFFHRTDLHGFWEDLVTDMRAKRSVKVTFEPTTTQKGPRAAEVIRINGGI